MNSFVKAGLGVTVLVVGLLRADASLTAADPGKADGILPTGLGEATDRDVERVRAATARFRELDDAVKAGIHAMSDNAFSISPTARWGSITRMTRS
jgi:hypothetical protein